MRTSTRAIDRILAGLLGLVLLAGGAWAIAHRLGQRNVVDTSARLDIPRIVRLPDEPWWHTAIGVGGVVLILLTAWLLIRHLRSSKPSTVSTPNGGTVDLGKVGDAVAEDLTRSHLVRRARSTTRIEHGRPVIRVSASVPHDAPLDDLKALTRAAQREVTAATNSDVLLQVLVNGDDRESAGTAA